MKLKQFIPQEFCLACTVCCRFAENPSIWAPRFSQEEMRGAVIGNMVPPQLFSCACAEDKKDAAVFSVALLDHQGGFRCSCFSPDDSMCRIYTARPFECQLYPFLLLKKDERLFLAKDTQCPFLSQANAGVVSEYEKYLKLEFKKNEFVSFLKRYRDLFTEYEPSKLTVVFPVNVD